MRFYSTEGRVKDVSLREAITQGLAPDGGLYLPQSLPHFDHLEKLRGLSLTELSIELGNVLFKEELSAKTVRKLFEEAFNFPAPFISFPDQTHILELFHGPTLSFKDFGARFMAQLFSHLLKEEVTVLVATTGDTGSAVGQAFYGLPGVRVFILYPKGGVHSRQEKQLTTIGGNVKALEVDGTFEECQQLVRQALLDPAKEHIITTGNSINIARIFPQALYYLYAYAHLPKNQEVVFSVPCGNFGHLVSGIIAKRLGMNVYRFLAGTNINDEVPLFLRSGEFRPHTAYHTIAVSMDVGNPSNFPRLLSLYDGSLEKMQHDLLGMSFTDEEIRAGIDQMYRERGYLLDPHSAVSYLALQQYLALEKHAHQGIFFATAHPAKFLEKEKYSIAIPERLQQALSKPKEAIFLKNDYTTFKDLLFSKVV